MKILNFGSINIDHVYNLSRFVQPGETLCSDNYQTFIGGKGCNQSVALAKSGAKVYHAGCIGNDGLWIRDQLNYWGANTDFIKVTEEATGHAIIQVNESGENAIILHGGANENISSSQIDKTLRHFGKGDLLLLQNEINNIANIIGKASAKGMTIFFNPAPMSNEVLQYPLDKVNLFIVNNIEGKDLTNQTDPKMVLEVMAQKFPFAGTLLTLGKDGAIYVKGKDTFVVKALEVQAVDTTAAGDTFIGYFLGGWMDELKISDSLRLAAKAAALSVTRKGGAVSIPNKEEVER